MATEAEHEQDILVILRKWADDSTEPSWPYEMAIGEIEALREENARLKLACRAALRYDEAIQRRTPEAAAAGTSWVDGGDLDQLYETWIGLATEALAGGNVG